MVRVFSVRFVLPFFAFLLFVFSSEAREIPFEFVDGFILVHASVNAQPVTLMIDSGASASVLSIEAARRLHISVGEGTPVDGVEADGVAYEIPAVTPKVNGFSLARVGLAIDLQNAEQLCSERVDGLGRLGILSRTGDADRLCETAPADFGQGAQRKGKTWLCVRGTGFFACR